MSLGSIDTFEDEVYEVAYYDLIVVGIAFRRDYSLRTHVLILAILLF